MFTKRPFGHRNKTIRQKWLVRTATFGHLYLVVEPVSLGQGVDDLSDPSYLIHPISASGGIRLTQGGIYIVAHSEEK